MSRLPRIALVVTLLVAAVQAGQAAEDFANFESSQVHPVALSADTTKLFSVNTPDGRLSIFDVAGDGSISLATDIPVGIDPVSLAVHGSEVWVVNHISDSVSVIDVPSRRLVATIRVGDEPTDIVFAHDRAFVSMAGARDQVKVIDASTREEVRQIDIFGDDPRSLAVSEDGSEVYLAVLESGNRTTSIGSARITAGGGAPPPVPAKSGSLPPAPKTALIVSFDEGSRQWMDETGRSWADSDEIDLPDEDIFVLDTATLAVTRTISGVGTTLFDVAVQPGSAKLWVPATDARNAVRFEPNLRGHFVDTKIARIDLVTGIRDDFDLNPHIDYGVSPGPAHEIEQSIAIPGDIAFNADGSVAYVTAFGSSSVAVLNVASGDIGHIAVGGGPSGVALAEGLDRLYVLNRFDNTISVVDTASSVQIATAGLAGPSGFDPSPDEIRRGRHFLYDARLSSGHGDSACASCHVFGNFDGVAWDLGDPTGAVLYYNLIDWVQFIDGPALRKGFHPMKGPMVTQTLRGLDGLEPFHWRGDKRNFQSFNGAFVSLMGKAEPLSAGDIDAFTKFMMTVRMPPSPFRTIDDQLPPTIAVPKVGGHGDLVEADTRHGEDLYRNGLDASGDKNCVTCHPLPNGTAGLLSSTVLESQELKISQLRNLYEKMGFQRTLLGSMENIGAARQKSGFGVLHAGATSMQEFLLAYFIAEPVSIQEDVAAFLMAFPTGTAPVIGRQRTLTRDDARTPEADAELAQMMAQAEAGNCDLIVKGHVAGRDAGFLYDPTSGRMLADLQQQPPVTDADLRSSLAVGDVLTYTAVPAGSGRRLGIDRDRDSWLDGDEATQGTDAAAPQSTPVACTTREEDSITSLQLKTKNEEGGVTLSLRGSTAMDGFLAPAIDLAANGLTLDLRDSRGDVLLHLWIPAESWKSRDGVLWRFRDKGATKGGQGIDQAGATLSGETLEFSLRGRRLGLALPPSAFPLTMVVVFGNAEQEYGGQCGRLTIDASRCRFSKNGISCR